MVTSMLSIPGGGGVRTHRVLCAPGVIQVSLQFYLSSSEEGKQQQGTCGRTIEHIESWSTPRFLRVRGGTDCLSGRD